MFKLALAFATSPPEGSSVNFSERNELLNDDPDIKQFVYAASLPNDRLELIEVSLERSQDTWTVNQVGYQLNTSPQGIRLWLQTPPAYGLFILFSLSILYLLIRPSFFRRWLQEGLSVIRSHRRLVGLTLASFYGLFFLGALTGSTLPEVCNEAILDILNAAITAVGATDAYNSLNIARAATVTFFQNFGVVSLSLLFSLALFFGIPAYLFTALSFYTQGIPFGLVTLSPVELLGLLILLVLELTSYFLIVAGGGILLATLIKEGFAGYRNAIKKCALMLPFALILLLIGAWYEAGIIILPQLLGP